MAVEQRGDEGLARAVKETFNVVLTDLRLPGLNGLDLVGRLHAAQPRLPIILITAFGTTETAIEATKFGAYDYLLKPFDLPRLLDLVRRAADSNRLMSEPVELGAAGAAREALVGHSAAMQSVYKDIGRVASKPVDVLLQGETGTGKELIARALYQHSARANAPFIAINCAAIPETLLESELFGHERGAFTGADSRRIGRFEQAHRGTLFLDEIGDMSLGMQGKLLRVLQERALQRLGGKETIPIDVRVVAATHRDLEAAIRQKEFREDLYYRLSVVVITLPPLRDRREDIPELVRFFLNKPEEESRPAPSHSPSFGVLRREPGRIETTCSGSTMSRNPFSSSMTMLCRPTSTNSECGTAYSFPSDVRMMAGPLPTNRCRINSRFMPCISPKSAGRSNGFLAVSIQWNSLQSSPMPRIGGAAGAFLPFAGQSLFGNSAGKAKSTASSPFICVICAICG